MTTYFSVNGININTMFAAPGAADASNNTLTGYTHSSGTAIKFLKPFYTGTTKDASYNSNPIMYATANFLSNSANIKFCPSYVFYRGNESTAFTAGSTTTYSVGTTATTIVTPSAGITRMLVLLVGGGGGGGGGGSKSGGGAGGGGGGGAGGINIFSINIVSNASFTINVGGGGKYGFTNGNEAGGPGDEDNTSPNVDGGAGGSGSSTTFIYNTITYTANGGSGGSGGINTGGGTAGTGATTNTTNSPIYFFTGNNGNAGSYGSTPNSGGAGGKSKYNQTINTTLFNLISNQVSYNNNNISTSTKLQYGEGGNGGKGDTADNWGWNGEFGAPGCAFVFYFYN